MSGTLSTANGVFLGQAATVRRSITTNAGRHGPGAPRPVRSSAGPGCGWRALTAGNMASATIGDAVHAPCPGAHLPARVHAGAVAAARRRPLPVGLRGARARRAVDDRAVRADV